MRPFSHRERVAEGRVRDLPVLNIRYALRQLKTTVLNQIPNQSNDSTG